MIFMKNNKEKEINVTTAFAIAFIVAGSVAVMFKPLFGCLLLMIGGIAGLSLTINIFIDYVTRKDK